MVVHHVTTTGVLAAILREGIRPDLAQTVRREVWLVESNRLLWAFAHVARRHNVPLDGLVAVTVAVPACRLRSRGNGLHTTTYVLGPDTFRAVSSLALRARRVKG